ncbi:MAG: HAMP domain-containing sensor histidine kinase [Actinomycetota bacterium]
MRFGLPSGIRARVVVVTVATAAVVVVAAGVIGLRSIEVELRESVDRELIDSAERAAPALAAATIEPELVAVLAESAVLSSGVRVIADDGSPVVLGNFPVIAAVPDRDQITDVSDRDDEWRVLTIRFDPLGSATETTVQVAASLEETNREIAAIRRRISVVGAGALVLAAVGGWLAGSLATAPLRRLARQAAAASRGEGPGAYTERQGVHEVDQLAQALNAAAERVRVERETTEAALAAARGFTADASHELGTPLMAIGTDLDVLAAHPDLPDDQRAEIIAELRNSHGRLLELLGLLRALAQGGQQDPRSFETVDLADVVDDVVDDARRRTPELRIDVDVPDHAPVRGWEPGLRLLVDNLLRNAAVHGGERVEVALGAADGVTTLRVDDDGPGFPAGARDRLLERFARGDTEASGSGLGLALVAQQVELHDGRLALDDAPLGGARAQVELASGAQAEPQ